MKITKEELKKLSVNERYNKLYKVISYLFEKYISFFETSKEFDNLIREYLSNIENLLEDEESNVFTKCEKLIKQYVCKYINEKVKNEHSLLIKYINNNKLPNDLTIKKLDTISKSLTPFSSILTIEILIELINKSLLNEILIAVFNEYNKQIINNKIDNLTSNRISIQLIEIYCMINNIELNECEEEELLVKTDDIFYMYMRDIPNKLLTKEEERELFIRYHNNDKKAREDLVKHNLKLVITIAKKYQGRGLEFNDLIQEGNIGLMHAIESFDYEKGFKFSTYATWGIRQKIDRAIRNKGRIVRLPSHRFDEYIKLVQCARKIESKKGTSATIEEIATELDRTVEEVSYLFEIFSNSISLNNPIDDENGKEMGEFIPNEKDNLEDSVDKTMLKEEIRNLILNTKLSPKERDILILRFGLDGNDPMTLEQVGNIFSITRERVRQIEAKILSKLRRTKKIEQFASYMDSPDTALKSLKSLNGEKYKKKRKSTKKNESHQYVKFETIFDIFPNTTYDELMIVLKTISPKGIQLIERGFGVKLDKKINTLNWLKEDIDYLYQETIPLIKQKLEYVKKNINKGTDIMSKKLKSIYEYCKGYDKEIVDNVIKNLEENEKKLLKKAYGEDLANPVRKVTLTSDETDLLYGSLIPRIKARVKNNGKKNNFLTIYEYFDEYTKEQIDSVVVLLDKDDKDVLEKAYGDDLSNPKRSDEWNSKYSAKLFNGVFYRMGRLLSGKELRRMTTIYEYYHEYSKEIIDKVIENLSDKEKKFLKRAYGEDLTKSEKNEDWTDLDRNKLYNRLIPKIGKLLEDEKVGKSIISIYRHFEFYTKEQIDEIIKDLTNEEKKLIIKGFGNDLENPIRDVNWTKEDSINLYDILLPKIKEQLKKIYLRKYKTIFEKFSEYPKEKIKEIIDRLPVVKTSLEELYGDDLENPKRDKNFTSVENAQLRRAIYAIKKELNGQKDKKKAGRSIRNLYIIFSDYSREEVDNVIDSLDDKRKKLLKKAYGNDFDNPKRDYELWTKEDQRYLNQLLVKIRKILSERNSENKKMDDSNQDTELVSAQLSQDDIGIDVSEAIVCELEAAQTIQELNTLESEELINGLNVLKEEETVCEKQEVKFNQNIYDMGTNNDELDKDAYLKILTLLKTPSFGELLTKLDVTKAVIIVLKLGYIKEQYYSSEAIGTFLGMTKEEVDAEFIEVLEIYKNSFNSIIDSVIEGAKRRY